MLETNGIYLPFSFVALTDRHLFHFQCPGWIYINLITSLAELPETTRRTEDKYLRVQSVNCGFFSLVSCFNMFNSMWLMTFEVSCTSHVSISHLLHRWVWTFTVTTVHTQPAKIKGHKRPLKFPNEDLKKRKWFWRMMTVLNHWNNLENYWSQIQDKSLRGHWFNYFNFASFVLVSFHPSTWSTWCDRSNFW